MADGSLKQIVKNFFNSLGFDIVRKKPASARENPKFAVFYDRLENMKKHGFNPAVIFDCGAHKGGWSKELLNYFPNAKYFLFEPNPLLGDKIESNLSKLNINHKLFRNAVGPEKGTAELNLWSDIDVLMVGSSICGHVAGEPSKKFVCDVISLDDIARENNVQPDIIKLDLQGYEIEALKGCKELLKTTELFMIEFGCLDAYLNRASVRDLIDLMFDNNYCLYDISDLAYRPYDNALTGGDFFFLKNSSKLRSYKAWK